jgi:NADPH:quinone reductase
MLAVEVTKFGGPDVLVAHQVADPVPGPGQVVVRVHAVDVLFVEAQVRTGWGQGYFAVQPPYVPGDGVAGVVAATGDGVDTAWLNQRVVGYTGSTGAYAERAVVDAALLVPIPDGVTFEDAAAVSHDGPMALTLVEAADLHADQQAGPGGGPGDGPRVLVLGANGGAGLLVTDLAARAGAHVIGAARGDAKRAQVKAAGAHETVDPTDPDWLAAVGQVDVVFDGVGGELGTAAFATVADGGRFFAYGAPTGGFATTTEEEAQQRGITVYGLPLLARARDEMTTLATRILTDKPNPAIGATYPLAETAAAHAALESRTVLGKIVLTAN